MTQREIYPFNIFVPNLLNICIDHNDCDEISGRLYHCYSAEPVVFENVVEMIQASEKLFDAISFPQASTKTRSFQKVEDVYEPKPEKVIDQLSLLNYKGEKATLITSVRFRQMSTWQGEFFSMETMEKESFFSMIDFIKKIDQTVNA